MKKVLSMLLAALVAFSAMLAFATVPAFADDDDEEEEAAPRLHLFAAFPATEMEFPEDEDFFISHGWLFGPPWSTEPNQAAALADTTRFDLYVDGELVDSEEIITIDSTADTMNKAFRTDFDDDDAEDTHVFTGVWYLDGVFAGGTPGTEVLWFTWDLTVHFVEFDDDDDDDDDDWDD